MEKDRAPPSSEIPPQESELDLHPSGCWTSDLEVLHVQRADAAAGVGLAIGQMLSGRYRIERELGEGGMGVVYLVRDQQVVGETFAVKVLKQALDPEALRLLREEVHQTRKLSHPNIVDMHSVNVDGKRLYVLMEYLEGKTLNALLDEEFGRGMPLSHAWPIIADVGAALGYAHDHNVIHSDLKPANVLLTTSGRTKLLDFGIARVSRGPLLHKRSGQRALTPAYASYEMLKGEEADRRDDIYSFACVIYEMLSGHRPFGELNALEARDVGTRVPPLAVLSRAQNEALAQALAFDRTARTGSVEQLLEGLADRKPRARPVALFCAAILVTIAALGLVYFALDRWWLSKHLVVVERATSNAQQAASVVNAPTTAAFNPPPHSVAVLPFVNMSGDKEQEYFSDGLSEELLNDLARINELQVAARTSAFSFKGKDTDIGTIARKLNVGTVLEGSVRRSVHRVRVTAQLINAVTGYHLWSETYDRDLGDILELQTEIATAVASALKATLLGDEAARIELGGTRNPAAFDAYLRASKAHFAVHGQGKEELKGIAAYSEAISLDPKYALAYLGRSIAYADYVRGFQGPSPSGAADKAQSDARRAIALAPELGEAHMALAYFLFSPGLDFAQASHEYERALALAPGKARVLWNYGTFAATMGRFDAGIAAVRRAVVLDPLNPRTHMNLGIALLAARHYDEAMAAFQEAITLDPDYSWPYAGRGIAYYLLGESQSAASSCGTKPDFGWSQVCLAVTYDKLGRHADAESWLAMFRASTGDAAACAYAIIYAQWGDKKQALHWLDSAVRLHDPDLAVLKVEPLLDPLRDEPRFKAIERALKFPD